MKQTRPRKYTVGGERAIEPRYSTQPHNMQRCYELMLVGGIRGPTTEGERASALAELRNALSVTDASDTSSVLCTPPGRGGGGMMDHGRK